MAALLRRLLREDAGQDLVEYALLAACVGLAGLAAVGFLQQALHDVYSGWDSNQQSLWTMPAPGAGGS